MGEDEVCAIVVLFNPDQIAIDNFYKTQRLFRRIIVVDNSNTETGSSALESVFGNENIEYISNGNNHGIAVALNQGVRQADKAGYLGVVLLDQDTELSDNMLDELLCIYNEKSELFPVAVAGSNYTGSLLPEGSARSVSVDTVITSGSLLSIEAYEVIGSFNEKYFIDGVDLEYCLRAKIKGFRVYQSTKVLMKHFIGAETKHKLLGLTFTARNHSPTRRYYLARNTVFLVRDFFKYFPLYSISSLINVLRIAVYVMLFEENKKDKLFSICLGLKHGFLNITGKKPELI
mgnify:CR=1 FL=1